MSPMAEDELDWEEWDGVAPFWQHMVAGSCAGVIEHTCMFPVDTLKTHVQCADCPQRVGDARARATRSRGARRRAMGDAGRADTRAAAAAAERAVARARRPRRGRGRAPRGRAPRLAAAFGALRECCGRLAGETRAAGRSGLWRGVGATFGAVVPAHAAYFSVYESAKLSLLPPGAAGPGGGGGGGAVTASDAWLAGAGAGALATLCHDAVMTPADVVKQRLQLGHHAGFSALGARARDRAAARRARALVRSLPTTLAMNVPHGAAMVGFNELFRALLAPPAPAPAAAGGAAAPPTPPPLDLRTCLLAGTGAARPPRSSRRRST